MNHPKTLKEIPVSGHIRKTPGGGVTTVDPHLAKREVNVDGGDILNDFHNKAKQVRSEVLDFEGKLKISEEDAASKLIELYKKNGNGFDEGDLKDIPNSLGEVLKQGSQYFQTCEDSKYMKSFDIEGMANLLTHPDYINQLHDRAKIIKDRFEKAGVTTSDQIDPFSFGLKENISKELNLYDINMLFRKPSKSGGIHESLNAIAEKHKVELGGTNYMDTFNISRQVSDVIKVGLLNNRKITSTILPSIIISNIVSPHLSRFAGKDDGQIMNLSRKESSLLGIGLAYEFDNELKATKGSLIFGGVDDIRKRAVNKLENMNKELGQDHGDEMINFFKKVDDAHLIPAVNMATSKGIIPSFMLSNKGLLGDIQKLSEKMVGVLKPNIGQNIDINITASKNPLAILTMSPNDTVPSCQSIVNTNKSRISISTLNMNVTGALNSHRTNDFIIFKNNKQGEKAGRASLNYSKSIDKFRYFEESPVYGNGVPERNDIRGFITIHKDDIIHDTASPEYFDKDAEFQRENIRVSSAIRRLKSIEQSINECDSLDELSKIQQPERGEELWNEMYKATQFEFSRELDLTGQSLLYSSDMETWFDGLELNEVKTKIEDAAIAYKVALKDVKG